MRSKTNLLFFPVFQTTGGWKRSPSSQASRKAGGSSEDLLSDSASVASDVSDTSANSSLLGKRTLAPPTKVKSFISPFDNPVVFKAPVSNGHLSVVATVFVPWPERQNDKVKQHHLLDCQDSCSH